MFVQGRRPADHRGAARVAAGCSAPSEYEHSYPHCWRCDTPLIYYAKTTWYVRTTAMKDELLADNETIDWHPEHIKHGRFGDWLREQRRLGAVPRALLGHAAADLALRRRRRPRRLRRLARRAPRARRRRPPDDLHRPYVDDVDARRARSAAAMMRRVPELIDVWWDSGCMPFAQWHAPFENQEHVRAALPRGLHLRGARPDARLVLLAAGDLDAAVRPRAPTRRASASA